MSRDANGNYTLPAGNPVVSGSLITSSWANGTMPDLGLEITGSLSREGKGAMVAPLKIVDESGATPGLAFNEEPTSGLRRVSAGDLRLVSQGVDVFRTNPDNKAPEGWDSGSLSFQSLLGTTDTVATMLAGDPFVGARPVTKGYTTPGDEGTGAYLIKTAAEYGGTPFARRDFLTPSGNVAELQDNGKIEARNYGDRTDPLTLAAAVAYAKTQDGGIVHLTQGVWASSDLDIDGQNIILRGETSGYGYEQVNPSVRIQCDSGVYAIHLKRVDGNNNAKFSGLENVLVQSSTEVEYGVLISEGATIMGNVSVQGFQHGCTIAQRGNQNTFDLCSFAFNTQSGFAITEFINQAYLHPNVTFNEGVVTTTVSMSRTNIRQNDFGVILREGDVLGLQHTVIESNEQAGLLLYQPAGVILAYGDLQDCWLENNYANYISGSSSYSIVGNNFLKITDSSTYIDWNSVEDAGFQVWMGSEVEDFASGPPRTWGFHNSKINALGTQQKWFRIKSVTGLELRNCATLGGDAANGWSLEPTASYVHLHDVNGQKTSFVGGNRSAIFRVGSSSREDGGLQVEKGTVGAQGFQFPIAYAPPVGGDPNTLTFYEKKTFTASLLTGATTAPTVTGRYERFGSMVRVGMVAGFGAVTSNAAGVTIGPLPFPAKEAVSFSATGYNRLNFDPGKSLFWLLSAGGTTLTLYEVAPNSATFSPVAIQGGTSSPILENFSFVYEAQ